jgi:hypothetical protein
MYHGQGAQPEHWALLAVFFTLFALYGLLKKPRPGHAGGTSIVLGLLSVAANAGLLMLANHVGYDSYDVLALLTLKLASVESSFIIFGYCLIVSGITRLVRTFFAPTLIGAGRPFL